jgi:hypothetical protein
MQWFCRSYPNTTFHLLDFSRGSSSSCFALKHLQDVKIPIDLLIVDHSLNDAIQTNILTDLTENIVREAISRKTAVIYLSDRMMDNTTEVVYSRVTQAYHIPLLSYRLAVIDRIPRPFPSRTNFSDLWKASIHFPHPNKETHFYITWYLTIYLNSMIRDHNDSQERSNSKIPSLPKNKLFNQTSSSSMTRGSLEYCLDPYVDLSSDEDTPTSISQFLPSQPEEHRKVHKYVGWEYTMDRPGKPFGWISGASSWSSNRTSSLLIFDIVLVHGQISLTYLSTYQNAGVIEIYLASKHYLSIPFHILNPSPFPTLRCCNATKEQMLSKDPRVPFRLVSLSTSAWIDTFQSKAKESTEAVMTYQSPYYGNYLLVIEHHP